MKPLPIVLTKSAAAAIREASEWWAANRQAVPTALVDDLETALALISVQPGIGARATSMGLDGVRRVLLARIRYHVYYRVSPAGTQIEILAFWHTSRGSDPPIKPENQAP